MKKMILAVMALSAMSCAIPTAAMAGQTNAAPKYRESQDGLSDVQAARYCHSIYVQRPEFLPAWCIPFVITID